MRSVACWQARPSWHWKARARVTLGERLATALKSAGRAALSVATLGLSEVMFRLSKPGQLTGNEPLPPLDLVVGPTEAAILIVDGAVGSVLTAERLATHDAWQRIDVMLGHGPHLEVVMLDLAPLSLSIPLEVVMGGEELWIEVDADLGLDLAGSDRILGLLARSGSLLAGKDLNVEGSEARAASFITSAAIAGQLKKRLAHRIASMGFCARSAAEVAGDPSALRDAELEIQSFLAEELGRWGIAVDRCQLLISRTESQQLELDSRRLELEQQRADLMKEALLIDERREARLAAERIAIASELDQAQQQSADGKAQRQESSRFALARMVMQNDQELAKLERDGFRELRADERDQELLDFRHRQLLMREDRKAQLEQELLSAQNELDTGRLRVQLEREKLELAALAQEQNLDQLGRIKQLEREDHLARQAANAAAERDRLAAAKDLSPEQMMAAMADKDPEIARAMAGRLSSEAEFARKSAEEQKALMIEMQAQMFRLMEKGLDSNAAVATGIAGAHRPPAPPSTTQGPVIIDNRAAGTPAPPTKACTACGEGIQPNWKACPFCGNGLA